MYHLKKNIIKYLLIHNSYMDAYMRMARAAESPQKALEYYLKASEYPLNLAVGPREPNLRGFL